MLSIEYKSSISEVLDIINNMEDIYREKISTKFMEFLVKNQNENYMNHMNPNLEINEQIKGKKTKEILAIIAYNYWYNEEQREEYKKRLKENEEAHQQELRKLYDTNNLFKGNRESEDTNNMQIMVVQKKKWYQKIFEKIKEIFREMR